MGGLIVFAIIGFIIVLLVRAGSAAQRALLAELALVQTGIPAQGILLQVDSYGTRQLINGYVYERRGVILDVEMPGQPPYQVRVTPLFPVSMVRNVLPGVSLQLRVDPKSSQTVAVVAPGNLPPSYFLPAGGARTA